MASRKNLPDSEGQLFGTERLRKLLNRHHEISATEMADRVLNEVDWFSQNALFPMTATLVVMK